MTKKELSVILNSIRNAQNNIEVLGFEEDEDIRKMYYELNDMCILLNEKIKGASN